MTRSVAKAKPSPKKTTTKKKPAKAKPTPAKKKPATKNSKTKTTKITSKSPQQRVTKKSSPKTAEKPQKPITKRRLQLEVGELISPNSDSDDEEEGEDLSFESISHLNEQATTQQLLSHPDLESQAVDSIKNKQIPEDLIKELSKFVRDKVSSSTLRTYEGNRNSVIKRGYPFTLVGLLKLIMSEKEDDLRLSNQSIECIISTLKYFHFVETLGTFTEEAQRVLSAALATRKRKHPDQRRITGAMNSARTAEFERFLKKKQQDGRLDSEETKLFCDVSWTLYACALRVFQLRLLEPSSFYEVPIFDAESGVDEPQLFVKVRPKGAEKMAADFERKQVHPRYASAIRRIVKSRSIHTKIFDQFDQSKVQKFSDLLIEAARAYGWPGDQRFSGTHCFRHGAAQDAFLESNGDLYVVKLRTGHLSKKAAEHYAKSDLERSGALRMHTADDNEKSKQLIADKLNEAKQKITKFFHEKSVFKAANCLSASADEDSDNEIDEDEPIVVVISEEEAKSSDTIKKIQELEKTKDPLTPYRRPMRIILPQLLVTPTEVVMPDGASVFLSSEQLNDAGIRRIKKGFSPDDEEEVIRMAWSTNHHHRGKKRTRINTGDFDAEPVYSYTNGNEEVPNQDAELRSQEQIINNNHTENNLESPSNKNEETNEETNEDTPPSSSGENVINNNQEETETSSKKDRNKERIRIAEQIRRTLVRHRLKKKVVKVKLEDWDDRSY